IGAGSAARLLDHMAAAEDPIGSLAEAPAPSRAAADWPAFADLVAALRSGRAGWPAELGAARLWYEPHLERMHEDASV
ncbi:hypothetical protein ABTD73_21725, partial [Acinetobacter baumannii]